MNIEKDAKISATPEVLWSFLVDSEKLKKWNPEIISDEPLSPGPTQAGSKSKLTMKEGSGIAEYETEIIDFVPHQQLSLTLKGGPLGSSPMHVAYQLEKSGDSTNLIFRSEWQPKELWLRLLSPLISIMANKNAKNALARMKQLVESARHHNQTESTKS